MGVFQDVDVYISKVCIFYLKGEYARKKSDHDIVFLSLLVLFLQDPPADPPTEQLEAQDHGADVSHEAAQDNWWYIGRGTGV